MMQGVGYRYQVRGAAVALGATGWVQSLEDGGILVHVEGDDQTLRSFSERLGDIMGYGRINDQVVESANVEGCTSFEIRY